MRPVLLFFVCVALACGASGGLPPEAVTLNARGAEALAAGDLDDADARFRLALEFHERFAEPRANLGVVMLRRGDLDGAERHLRAALQLNDEFDEAWSNLGVVLRRRGALDEAAEAFERALALDPALVAARRNLADIWLLQGAFAEARAQLQRLVQLVEPTGADGLRAHALLAYADLRLERPDAAQRRAEQVLRAAPEHAVARTVRGALHARAARPHAALSDLAAALDDEVVGFDARLRLAAVRLSMGDLPAVTPHLRVLRRVAPEDPAVRLLAGWHAAGERDWGVALAEAQAVLRTHPGTESARQLASFVCAEAGPELSACP